MISKAAQRAIRLKAMEELGEELGSWLLPEVMLFSVKHGKTYHVMSEERGMRVWNREHKQFTGDYRVVGACGKIVYVKMSIVNYVRVDCRNTNMGICPFCEQEITGVLNIRSEGYRRWYAERKKALALGIRVHSSDQDFPEPAL